jgi:CheY-like chemotaxis protein
MSSLAGRKILIVDDNVDSAESMAFVLRTLGHAADYISDPRRAVAEVRERKPDAVFLDIGMPHLDGYELARLLKQENGDMCIVAISGHDSPQDRKRGREAGFDAHVAKPADTDMLQSILATVFGPRAPR